MKVYEPEERERRANIVKKLLGSAEWKIVSESVQAWCEAKTDEVVLLHADGKDAEAKELALLVNAVRRVYMEPEIIIRKTSAWLKTWEWLKKIKMKKEAKQDA